MKRQTKLFKTILIAAAATVVAGSAYALNLNWSGPGGTTSSPTSGIWDMSAANWNNGAAVFASGNGAILGGADGAYFIQCNTALTATNITFAASGYTLTNDVPTTLTLPANGSLFAAAGKSGTIGTNVTVSGNGNALYFNPNAAAGTLIVENGGSFIQSANQPFQISGGPGSKIRVETGGRLALTGNGSNIRIGVAANDSPEVIVEGGAFYISPNANGATLTIGNANGATGTVTIVSGVVSNTGPSAIRMGENAGSTGVLNLNGGLLSAQRIFLNNASALAIFNFNGGRLQAINGASAATFMTGLTVANVRNTNSTIDANGFNITIGQPLRHSTIPGDNATDGGLTIIGAGSVTLAATNTYTGMTVVTNGTLGLGTAGSINSSSQIAVNSGGTLSLGSRALNYPGTLSMTDGAVQVDINNFPTNVTVGTLATAGTANIINVSTLVGSGSIPQATPLIKYTSLAPGVVDGNNVLTTLGVVLPGTFVGYLSNNVAKSTIDLVLTAGSLKPQIVTNPVPITRYHGLSAQFSVTALGADGYFWQSNGVFLNDGGNVLGSHTNLLMLSNVSTTANYDVVVTNSSGSVTSSIATLTIIVATNYAGTNVLFSPVSYYRFGETDSSQPAHDYVGGKDGVYLADAFHVVGPQPADGYVNFENDNEAVQAVGGFSDAYVAVSNSWNINTNTVTLVAWVYPVGSQAAVAGVIFNRGGGVTCGMNYTGSTNSDGNFTLGYTWNNDANTYNWNSGLVPPLYQWSLVALVVTPTNATIYVGTTNGLTSAVHTYPHPAQAFNGPITIGSDSFDPIARSFTGSIDEVSAFDKALSADQITALLSAASSITNFPPVITAQPVASQTKYQYQTAQFSVQVSGTAPFIYQWQAGTNGVYVNLTDGGRISGSQTGILTITNLALTDPTNYMVIITNSAGSVTSSVASLTVNPVLGPATNITTSVIQGSGNNWDTPGTWSLAGSATDLAAQYYGSTFTIQAPGGLRTPDLGSPNSPTSVTFPGEVLRVEGNGTFDTSLTAAGAIRIKGGNPATVYFKKLVMAGGQISSILNSGWPAILTGEVNVISNTVVWASDDTSPRSIILQSVLTGNGSIQYHGYISTSTFRTDTSASLDIANANNPYTGTWNVELGTVVGSVLNALGTNTITVGAQGALQTTYDVNNTNADLILNGRLNLTQNDTFRTVTINGSPLPAGTHLYTELTNSYPANFPATWTGIAGATSATNVMGSLTVLTGSATASYPTNITFSVTGNNLSLSWPTTHLGWHAQSNSIALANTNYWFDIPGSQAVTNLSITITPAQTNVFYRLRHP